MKTARSEENEISQLLIDHSGEVGMSISTPGPKDKYSICYAYYHKMEKAKILKMAIIEPFGRHYIGCENWLEENGFADESELATIKELISIPRKGR